MQDTKIQIKNYLRLLLMLLLFSSAIAITKSLAMRKPIERSKIKSNKKKKRNEAKKSVDFSMKRQVQLLLIAAGNISLLIYGR